MDPEDEKDALSSQIESCERTRERQPSIEDRSIDQRLLLSQQPHQWIPNKFVAQFQISSSESLLWEGQMQERRRSCNASVKQRRAPLFIETARRYVIQAFVCERDLTVDQVKLNPSVNVSNSGISLRLPLNMKPARRASHRRRACILQSQGLCFSRFAGNRGR